MIGQFLASMGGHHIVTSQTLVTESLGVLALLHSNCMRDCNLNISIKKQETLNARKEVKFQEPSEMMCGIFEMIIMMIALGCPPLQDATTRMTLNF